MITLHYENILSIIVNLLIEAIILLKYHANGVFSEVKTKNLIHI